MQAWINRTHQEPEDDAKKWVVVTLFCSQITSELWHHCAALSRFLSLPLFFCVHVLPSIWYSAAVSTPRDTALFPASRNKGGSEEKRGREREEVWQWQTIWSKVQSKYRKWGKLRDDDDEGDRWMERLRKERRDCLSWSVSTGVLTVFRALHQAWPHRWTSTNVHSDFIDLSAKKS